MKSGSPKSSSSASVGRINMLFCPKDKISPDSIKIRFAYHEQGVVGTGANDPDLDAVLGIPLFRTVRAEGYGNVRHETHPGITIENVDIIASVQVIDGTFTIDLKSV